MDAIVQFLRNALCCVKDLHLLGDTFLYEKGVTAQYLGSLPPPLDMTTPLEVLISVTQLYACLSTSKAGINLVVASVGKLRRIVRLVETRMTTNAPPKDDWTQADRLVNESLLKEAKVAVRTVITGMLIFPIGCAFWWLFLNSWHVTSVDWFGGLPALIHALEVMEICLVPLLYWMYMDGKEKLNQSSSNQTLSTKISQLEPNDISIDSYVNMTGWTPFWESGAGLFAGSDDKQKHEQQKFQSELEKVKKQMATWFPESPDDGDDDKKKKDKDDGEKEAKLAKEAWEQSKEKLQQSVPTLRWEGYREWLYLVLNFIAFYGYLMGILVFYYEDEKVQPSHVVSLKFGYDNEFADWAGNFAGDLMWTIEPIVILGSPALFVYYLTPPKTSDKKVKAD